MQQESHHMELPDEAKELIELIRVKIEARSRIFGDVFLGGVCMGECVSVPWCEGVGESRSMFVCGYLFLHKCQQGDYESSKKHPY